MNKREAEDLLKQAGFEYKGTTRHANWEHRATGIKCPVPNHKGDLHPKTAASIRRKIREATGL